MWASGFQQGSVCILYSDAFKKTQQRSQISLSARVNNDKKKGFLTLKIIVIL